MSTILSEISQAATNFNQAADFYHEHAFVQPKAARQLSEFIEQESGHLPCGPVIELGCGTGFLSKNLQHIFPDRTLILSDQSPKMLEACRSHVINDNNVHFEQFDAENIPADGSTYAVSASNFVAQWFRRPAETLTDWLRATKSRGLLAAAFPGKKSFPEWQKCANELDLPFTANSLPGAGEIKKAFEHNKLEANLHQEIYTQYFEDAADFFRHLKNTGATQQKHGRHLTSKEMRTLIKHWNQQQNGAICVSWHVVFLIATKH